MHLKYLEFEEVFRWLGDFDFAGSTDQYQSMNLTNPIPDSSHECGCFPGGATERLAKQFQKGSPFWYIYIAPSFLPTVHTMNSNPKVLLQFASIVLLEACFQNEHGSPEHIKTITSKIDDARLINADKFPNDWLSYGRNYAEDRYSALEQINKDNMKNLRLARSLIIGTDKGVEQHHWLPTALCTWQDLEVKCSP
jgi:hypothetical protein